MTCSSKTSAMTTPAQLSERRQRSTFTALMIAIVDAFQEALDMRRTAHARYPLSDE